MTTIPDVVIKNGRIVTANTAQHTRVYVGVAIVATLVATGLGGYIMGQSSAKPQPAAHTAGPTTNPSHGDGATPGKAVNTAASTTGKGAPPESTQPLRSEEHTSELQSHACAR
jgi:hypothetical protein